MIQFLFNRRNAAGIFAVDDINQLFGHGQYFLFPDLSVLDDVYRDGMVDKAQNIQIQFFNRAFYLNDVFSSHFFTAGVFDDSHTAVHLVQLQIFVDIHGFSGLDVVQYHAFI